jgi:hypothetical protein
MPRNARQENDQHKDSPSEGQLEDIETKECLEASVNYLEFLVMRMLIRISDWHG